MSDSLYAGKRFRTFYFIVDLNRELLHIEIETSITERRLIRIVERPRYKKGLPKTLRTDNGQKFPSEELVAWAESVGMYIQYNQPGKPNQNAYLFCYKLVDT